MKQTTKKDYFKIFSFVAAVMLLLLAVIELIKGVADFIGPNAIAHLSGINTNLQFDLTTITSFINCMLAPSCFSVLAVLTAVFLIVKKDSVAVFAGFGMLTFALVHRPISFLLGTVLNTFLSRLLNVSIYSMIGTVLSFVYLALSLVCALVLTAVLCVAASTFLKGRRFILGIILAAIFVVGAGVNVIVCVLSAITMFTNLIFTNLPPIYIILNFYSGIISPILLAVMRICLPLPAIFAAVGMISLKRKNDGETAKEEDPQKTEEIKKADPVADEEIVIVGAYNNQ